jgi:hypothetical protein
VATGAVQADEVGDAAVRLEGRPPEEALAWAAKRFAPRVAFATGFGAEGCLIVDLIARHQLAIEVFTLDTSVLFPETYALWRRLEERYDLTIRAVRPEGESAVLEVAAPAALLRYVVEKGSITVDGVSLTVAARLPDAFTVALIPHTMAVTTLGPQALERPVNLEVDVVAKYVESLAAPYAPEGTGG